MVAGVLGVGGWFAYQRFVVQPRARAGASVRDLDVARDAILSTVSATGSIEPEAEVSLVFRTAGPVANVLVAPAKPWKRASCWRNWTRPT